MSTTTALSGLTAIIGLAETAQCIMCGHGEQTLFARATPATLARLALN